MLIEIIKTDPGLLLAQLEGHGDNHYRIGINFLAAHRTDPCAARMRAN